MASVWLLYNKGLIWWKAADIVVLLEGSPISTEELWSSVTVTIGFLVTSLTKALLPRLLSLAGQPALGRVLVVPNFFHLKMEANVFLWTFKAADTFGYPSPDLCLDTILSRPRGLVFALSCTVNCGTLYRQVCAFPNQLQSIEFITDGLLSSCRDISRMIIGNRMHLSSISSHTAKGLNTYVNKVFLFYYL